MKYFFVSEDGGQTHIVAAKTRESALQIAEPLSVSYLYELTESTFSVEGFLASDLRKNKIAANCN